MNWLISWKSDEQVVKYKTLVDMSFSAILRWCDDVLPRDIIEIHIKEVD